VVTLFGRLVGGDAFVVEDDRFRPYFFVPEAGADRLRGEAGAEVEATELRDLRGRRVARVVAPLPGTVPALRERLEGQGVECLEADVRFPYRYLADHGLHSGIAIEGEAEAAGPRLLRFRNPRLAPAAARPALRVLSIDLETSPDASRLYSAALAGCEAEEVHLVAGRPVTGAVVHPDEAALLVALLARVRALDPDVIVGWNVVDFDLRVLERRCAANGLALELGRVPGAARIQQERGPLRQSRAEIPGRVVVDGLPLVREALRLEDHRLDTVARAVLGRGKLIDSEVPDAAREIARLWREDPEALVAYNLEDARLVNEILAREGLLALAVERSLLSGMPLDRVGASIASFDLLYLPELRRRGFVAASVRPERSAEGEVVRGGALLEPRPGLWRDVAVFDFKSLYPSLIRTFNLDPLGHARAALDRLGDAECVTAPNGARFSRADAILPAVIERMLERREAARARGDRHGDQAIKIMMNAIFGVLGAASCRFFDPEVANAITSFGQRTLHWTRDAFEAEGVRVLYGDTDSVFVALEAGQDPAALRAQVEERIGARVREQHHVEPRLVLELECVFERLFLPQLRGGVSGSKKRYAGWAGGRLHLVGLESVRRDWPRLAKRLQEGLLERLFTDRELLPFVRETVEAVRAGRLDAELVTVKRVRKGDLDRYTTTTPPHVRAARKAGATPGGVVRYVITREGPEPAVPGRPLPPGIDREHYVQRVIRPLAASILEVAGLSVEEALGEPRQLPLL
jgi:DNA polymerase-2